MGIGSGAAALIGGLASAGGSIASGALGSSAASSAAASQSAAAEQAAQLQYQESQNSLGFQQNEFNTEQNNLAPWLQSGAGALSNLDYLTYGGQPSSLSGTPGATGGSPQTSAPSGTSAYNTNVASSNGGAQSGAVPTSSGNIGNLTALASGGDPTATPQGGTITPGSLPTATNPTPVNLASSPNTSLGAAGSLLTPYSGSFTAPTAAEAEQTPGYQFQQQQGQQALQQSAAARGNLLTGGTAEALDNYSQGLAASNYQNVYNNAYNTYASNYNQYQNQQANTFNRLSALAGGGQTAASTLGTLGQSAANSVTSNELGTAGQIGQDVQNAGAANASGIVGSTNAITGAIGSGTNSLNQLASLQSLLNGGGSSMNGNLPGVYNTLYNAQNGALSSGPIDTQNQYLTGGIS